MSVDNANPGISCVECQRRKQKCNRLFPCNHCSKRGVAHLCRFVSKTANKSESPAEGRPGRLSRKRDIDSFGDGALNDALYEDGETSEFDTSDALNALGYMPHTHHLVLGNGTGPKIGKDPVGTDEGTVQSEELKAAMLSMPPKPYADCLVDNWLNGANSHYYALYPPEFRTQYDGWWTIPPNKVTPELTSLILRVCACSALYIMDPGVKERLESELRTDIWTFAGRMHRAAERLGASIPPGKGGLIHIQQQFLTAFWYKSAEKWTEAWHALGGAIRAANEIGLHKDSLSEGLSEFDREMRRRLWCILYLWDFALGSMLSRPLLVNHADCTFVFPTLALETDPEDPGRPSPFQHMSLHAKLCLDMAAQLTSVSEKDIPTEVSLRLRDVVQRFLDELPPVYAVKDPDTRWDTEHSYIVFQRGYLHLIGYMCLFDPLKPYVTRNSAKALSDLEKMLRAAGVDAALGLMDVSWRLFESLSSVGARFHYAVFCIFDTTTVLCSAFVHDEARNLPKRETVLEAIKKGMNMLGELHTESKTTPSLCRILRAIVANLPLSAKEKALIGVTKRGKASNKAPARGEGKSAVLSGDSSVGPSTEITPPREASSAASTSASVASHYTDVKGVNTQSSVRSTQSNQSPQQSSISSSNVEGSTSTTVGQSALTMTDSLDPTGWEAIEAGHLDFIQETNMAVYDGNVPTVLEYWDWQGLDLDIPVFWGSPPPTTD
ncbi:hypothetical protein V8F33_000190 [Rhypophila sp. PSN 637]